MFSKKSTNNQSKAQPERHSRQARSVQIADNHLTGIRLSSVYLDMPPAANVFFLAGVKVYVMELLLAVC